jgi:hypothetical protein
MLKFAESDETSHGKADINTTQTRACGNLVLIVYAIVDVSKYGTVVVPLDSLLFPSGFFLSAH